jgi:hypothetical protein
MLRSGEVTAKSPRFIRELHKIHEKGCDLRNIMRYAS